MRRHAPDALQLHRCRQLRLPVSTVGDLRAGASSRAKFHAPALLTGTIPSQHAVLRLQRAIILALVFLIDFCYFETSENNSNNNGIFLMS
jgi:hypothetical protein